MGSKAQAKANSENARRMKELGIRRRTTQCPICYRTVSLPLDKHLFNCN